MKSLSLSVAGLLALALSASAEIKLADIFADRMVLQRQQPIAVWGTASPKDKVNVSLGGAEGVAEADGEGHWLVTLPAREASGPFELKVKDGTGERIVRDIMIGDVWLVAGQSNMVLALQSTTEWPEVKTAGVFPGIRICKLPGNFSFDPAAGYPRPIAWDVLNSAKAGYFSGVGYHFARTMQPEIGVTLGVIQGSAGGTQIEQWIPEEALKTAHPESLLFAERDKARAEAQANPEAKVNAIKAGAATLYNGTIHPIRHLKLAGVLWYQGEANSRTKADYRALLHTWTSAWRTTFGEPKLPFVLVQLPGFGLPKDDSWMRLREAQMIAARELGIPLVVTIDQGSKETIHPANKAEVGRRAGFAALQGVYGKPVEGTSSVPESVKFSGGEAVVEFPSTGPALRAEDGALAGFELAGADKVFHPATGVLKGHSVIVSSPEVAQPVAVRYLWASCPEKVSLYTTGGLPISPFRSDK
jgi:sialate O-acetylesterase